MFHKNPPLEPQNGTGIELTTAVSCWRRKCARQPHGLLPLHCLCAWSMWSRAQFLQRLRPSFEKNTKRENEVLEIHDYSRNSGTIHYASLGRDTRWRAVTGMAAEHTKSGGPAATARGRFQNAVSRLKTVQVTNAIKGPQPPSSAIDRPDSLPHPELTGPKHPELTGPIHRPSRPKAGGMAAAQRMWNASVAPTTEGDSTVPSPTIESTELHLVLAQPFASLEGKEDACKMGLALDISRALGPGFELVKPKITSLQRGACIEPCSHRKRCMLLPFLTFVCARVLRLWSSDCTGVRGTVSRADECRHCHALASGRKNAIGIYSKTTRSNSLAICSGLFPVPPLTTIAGRGRGRGVSPPLV